MFTLNNKNAKFSLSPKNYKKDEKFTLNLSKFKNDYINELSNKNNDNINSCNNKEKIE